MVRESQCPPLNLFKEFKGTPPPARDQRPLKRRRARPARRQHS